MSSSAESSSIPFQRTYDGRRCKTATEYRNGGPVASESSPLLEPTDRPCSDSEELSKPTIFRQEMRTIATYALPVFLSQLLEFSLVIVEVVSVGHISTASLAGVSLGSMTASVTGLSVLQGITSALDTLLPSAFTSTQPQLVGLWAQRMWLVVCFALLPILATWLNAERILLVLRQEPEIARLAALYLRWFSFGLPAFAFNCISRRYFQSQGLFAVQNHIIMIVAPINVLLNYLLVWGPKSTRLGFIGAPIASSLSFTFISILSIIYGRYLAPKTAWHPISSKMFSNLGLLLRLGLGGIGQTASEWWAWELVALAASFLGPLNLASQSILLTSSATTFQATYALSNATSIRVGNLLGEKNARRAGVAATASIAFALINSSIISTIYLVFRNTWAHMFTSDPDVVTLVASVIPLIALFQVMDGNAAVTAGGILRARGEQFIGALLNISAYYVVGRFASRANGYQAQLLTFLRRSTGLPLGVWLAFRWDMGLHGLWTGLAVALTYCAVIGSTLCYRTDWEREVAKVVERVEAEERLRKATDEEDDPAQPMP
ncbi:putative multidrug oligosaccharidyl-lipid polysaccharide flippase [Lyophyllum shimeji]|uniref:Multidrug oligosaccharidyl-lipid polysaccharide flippase n=1 Tax=Lyophyllum shimeji TaxID=47721 RepID=A0A9P3PVI3_LYOSH|nr:putative multidrug oligosaccharidyl-lipid polysaccharide flippase [Lyophyllum shimeji]